jgi:hypothetical protein
MQCAGSIPWASWWTFRVLDPTTFKRRRSLTTSGSADAWFGDGLLRFETQAEIEEYDLRIEGPCSGPVKL